MRQSNEGCILWSVVLWSRRTPLPFNLPKIVLPGFPGAGVYELSPDSKDKAEAAKRVLETAGKAVTGLDLSRWVEAAESLTRTSGSSGFAIPINKVKSVLEDLKSGKPIKRAWLGAELGLKDGKLMIQKVLPDSPADKAGVKAGDQVVSADGKQFTRTRDFAAWVQESKPGEVISLVVCRDGKNIDLKVTLGAVPEPVQRKASATLDWLRPGKTAGFSLSLDDADIAGVARSLSDASGRSVIVNEPEKITKKISVHLKSTTIEKALDVICRNMNCKYTRDGDSYVISPR